jgi:hypothetical protein
MKDTKLTQWFIWKRKTAVRPAVNLQNHLSFMVELDGIEPTTS